MKIKTLLLVLIFALTFAPILRAQELYTGVWRQGNDGYYLWAGVDWNNFNNKWNELAKQNLKPLTGQSRTLVHVIL